MRRKHQNEAKKASLENLVQVLVNLTSNNLASIWYFAMKSSEDIQFEGLLHIPVSKLYKHPPIFLDWKHAIMRVVLLCC